MERAVGIYRQGHKVLRTIIQLVAVNVVDNLIRLERSTIGLLPYKTVFLDITVVSSQVMFGQIESNIAILNPALRLGPWFSGGAGPMAYRNVEAPTVTVAGMSTRKVGRNPFTAAASTWHTLIRYANEALAPTLAFRSSPFLSVALEEAKIRTVFMPRFRLDWKAAATGTVHAISIAQ
jgi:hypothetical protein